MTSQRYSFLKCLVFLLPLWNPTPLPPIWWIALPSPPLFSSSSSPLLPLNMAFGLSEFQVTCWNVELNWSISLLRFVFSQDVGGSFAQIISKSKVSFIKVYEKSMQMQEVLGMYWRIIQWGSLRYMYTSSQASTTRSCSKRTLDVLHTCSLRRSSCTDSSYLAPFERETPMKLIGFTRPFTPLATSLLPACRCLLNRREWWEAPYNSSHQIGLTGTAQKELITSLLCPMTLELASIIRFIFSALMNTLWVFSYMLSTDIPKKNLRWWLLIIL